MLRLIYTTTMRIKANQSGTSSQLQHCYRTCAGRRALQLDGIPVYICIPVDPIYCYLGLHPRLSARNDEEHCWQWLPPTQRSLQAVDPRGQKGARLHARPRTPHQAKADQGVDVYGPATALGTERYPAQSGFRRHHLHRLEHGDVDHHEYFQVGVWPK